MKTSDVLWSWDFISSSLIGLALYFVMPYILINGTVLVFYNTGITVLSIVFSIFFASLAIIISASDNDFIKFLEVDKTYTRLLQMFKFTLYVLFIGLVYSILLYSYSSYFSKVTDGQNKIFLSVFSFLFLYGLFCTFNSTKHSIKYAIYRVRFINRPDPDA